MTNNDKQYKNQYNNENNKNNGKKGNLLFLGIFFIIGYCEKVRGECQYFSAIFHKIATIFIHCFWEIFDSTPIVVFIVTIVEAIVESQ